MRPARLITAALLSLLVAGHLHAQIYPPGRAPSLDDIIRSHTEFKDSIRSARISYTRESFHTPEYVDSVVANEAQNWRHNSKSSAGEPLPPGFAEAVRLDCTGPRNIFEIYDSRQASSKRVTTDPRDIDSLVREKGLGDYARNRLSKTLMTGVTGGKSFSYGSSSNSLATHPYNSAPHPPSILRIGLLFGLPPLVENLSFTPDPSDASLYLLTFTQPAMRETSANYAQLMVLQPDPNAPPKLHKYVLDSSLDYRILSHRITREDTLLKEKKYEYADFDGLAFPASVTYIGTNYDGSPRSPTVIKFTSVEINVPIDPSEFTLDIPPDATIDDRTNLLADEARRDFPRLARDLVPDVYPPGRASPTETEPSAEPAPDIPADLAPTAPARPSAPPTPAPARDHTLAFILSLAAALLATIALILIRKGKRK